MPRWRRSARLQPCCRSCFRSAGRRTPARCGTGRCGSARPLYSRTPPRQQSRPRRSRPNPSWSGLMAATSAVGTGTGTRSATLRWSRAHGIQFRFAFARNGPAIASDAFKQALAAAGVGADTPATVLCDGDAGLWRLQCEALPKATIVLDWWHAAVRFEHALQAARGLGAGTADTLPAAEAVRGLERAKWRLWHGRWPGCRRKLAALCRWAQREPVRDVAGIGRLERHVSELLGYLKRNDGALVPYAARRRCGEPISTAFVESAVNEIVAKRMNKKQTSCPFPAPGNLGREARPGLCPGPAKGGALGTSLSVF